VALEISFDSRNLLDVVADRSTSNPSSNEYSHVERGDVTIYAWSRINGT